ncbi:Na+/Pi-cotransporter [Aliarcobacter thereius]|uniref:Na+/Pi-cotransporter n=1 Tax=Aliarcobacter thereius TaxID=544718 RepID=A0A1C0B8Y4_9BACT|nr:Na/Pi symporter [Aliarcobacter thereius]OCM00032.1 Na+/Pi-cotransporter [Aliarcobacter thereius]
MIKKVLFPLLFLVLAYFVLSYESAKEIIAGISIFLVGMFFMEDGFKLFSGGFLEKILEKFTNSMPKAILNGFLISSIVQSSSLTSVIIISFLGASLIALESAVYVLLGSSLGSSTTAWIIALFGLKIKISHYAMPIIVFGIFFRFSKKERFKGLGHVLLGLGFIFLGISYMVNGFYELKDSVDLTLYSFDGFLGLFIFFIIGAFMTFVVQSSSASTAIVLVALASGQIFYLNAIAAIIGGKIGSTTTTVLGALNSNANGKRLAYAQFLLNLIATLFGLILFYPIVNFIEIISNYFEITSDAIKLSIFITILNLSAVIIMIPFLKLIVKKIQKMFIPKVKSWSKLEFLDSSSLESSKSIVAGVKKENIILYENFLKASKHLLQINDEDLYWYKNNNKSKSPQNHKIDKIYKDRLRVLHDEILDFLSFANKGISENDLKIIDKQKVITKKIYSLLKNIRNINKKIDESNFYREAIKNEYIYLREILTICIKEIENIISNKTFDDLDKIFKIKTLQQKLNSLDSLTTQRVKKLIDEKKIDANVSTKIIKDISFAILLSQELIKLTISLYVEDSILIEEDEDEA